MERTKRALALCSIAFLVIYVISYIEEIYPTFHVARITASRNATKSSATRKKASSARVPWIPPWQRRGVSFARSFLKQSSENPSTSNPYWWCTEGTYDKSCRNENHMLCHPQGLLFVKTPKTGSTTISKIVKRIVEQVAQRKSDNNNNNNNHAKCQHREDHVVGAGLWYANRDPQKSFLMASLRDPADRAMSRFFWSYVTRHSPNNTQVPVDDEFILHYLNTSTSVASGCTSKGQGGYQLNYISMSTIPEWSAWNPSHPTEIQNKPQLEELVKQTVQDYDFILLNERMEESLVILQFLLGLHTGDIVSLSYNVGGSYRYEHGKCKQLIKSQVSEGMMAYFQSDEWIAKNYGDYLLFAAVNRSIDMTIEQIGRPAFDTALQEFRRLEGKVNTICNERVPFPCSANGTVRFQAKQSIPHDEIGRCVDDVVRQDNGFGTDEFN